MSEVGKQIWRRPLGSEARYCYWPKSFSHGYNNDKGGWFHPYVETALARFLANGTFVDVVQRARVPWESEHIDRFGWCLRDRTQVMGELLTLLPDVQHSSHYTLASVCRDIEDGATPLRRVMDNIHGGWQIKPGTSPWWKLQQWHCPGMEFRAGKFKNISPTAEVVLQRFVRQQIWILGFYSTRHVELLSLGGAALLVFRKEPNAPIQDVFLLIGSAAQSASCVRTTLRKLRNGADVPLLDQVLRASLTSIKSKGLQPLKERVFCDETLAQAICDRQGCPDATSSVNRHRRHWRGRHGYH